MGADGMDLGDDPYRNALLCGGEGGPLAGEPGPYDEYVVGWHEAGCYRRESRPGSRDSLNSSHSTATADRGLAEPDPICHGAEVDVLGEVVRPVVVGGLLELVATGDHRRFVARGERLEAVGAVVQAQV